MSSACKRLLIEVPAFARDSWGAEMTSYLRLGAVAEPWCVASADAMRNCTPEHGATTAGRGAGEDLAVWVTGFIHDDRHLCDPHWLDREGADGPLDAPRGHDVSSRPLRSTRPPAAVAEELEQLRRHRDGLRESLDMITAGPQAWLDSLVRQFEDARAQLAERQRAFDEVLRTFANAQEGVELDRRVPPAFCAPGYRPDDPSGEHLRYWPKAYRQQGSERLHSRGGWRDHTDGNRVTTTRGDKVEVVAGNYRMIVLGRHDQPRDASGNPVLPGWEVSGGHIDETTVTSVVPERSLSWRQRWNGNWYAAEEEIKADTKSILIGDSEEEAHGHWMVDVTGSENPDPWHAPEDCPGGACRTNPKIMDETWAEEILSNLGSEDAPIPLMTDETHARRISTETHARDMFDERVASSMATRTSCGEMRDVKTCARMRTEVVVDSLEDHTDCSLMVSANVSGLRLSKTVGATETRTDGVTVDVNLGKRANLDVGATTEIDATVLRTSLCVGAKAALTVGATLDASFPEELECGPATRMKNAVGPVVNLAVVQKIIGLQVMMG